MIIEQRKKIEELFNQYMKDVFGICYYILKDREASEDMVMETFEVALRQKDFSKIEKPKLWLLGTARNLCFKKIRQDKKSQFNTNIELFQEYFVESDLDKALLTKDLIIDKLLENLASLNMMQSKCLDYFYLQGKSYEDIADILSIEIKKVKSHLQNGKRNLKIRLEKELSKYE